MKLLSLGIFLILVTTVLVFGVPIENETHLSDSQSEEEIHFENGLVKLRKQEYEDEKFDEDFNDDDDDDYDEDEDDNDNGDDDDEEDADELSGDTFNYLGEDGKTWHKINLNDTLEDDDAYDYSNPEKMFSPLSFRSVQNDVTPKLYTKDNPDVPFELTTVNGRDSPINITHPTNVIIHGWLENGAKTWVLRMKDKFFIKSDHNVITLDWEKYAKLEYTFSARKTRKIGAYLGQVLVSLIKSEKLRVEDIHITGHSLGAHVAGIAAKTIKAQTGHSIGRLTGFDPARPLFESPLKVSKKKRLDKNDALFVDVIHSCGGSLGVKGRFGKVDFYPNKGKAIQPGCGLVKNHICSHTRAYRYFEESINSEKFVALKCRSWRKFKRGKCKKNLRAVMGYHIDTTIPEGKYYLRTKKRSPFAKGAPKK